MSTPNDQKPQTRETEDSPVSKPKVLVVDDDADNLNLVSKTCQWGGFETKTASNGIEALQLIEKWSPDLIFLDINMPGLSGLETLPKVRRREEYMSVIFLSAQSNTKDVIRGLDQGADDYICKPFHPEELLARARAQLRIKKLHDRLKEANEKLHELVNIDDLTGLYNMRSLYDRLEIELQRAERYNRHVCVIMMDMDHFKKVNDDHDHLFGSFVLSEVGLMIRQNIRSMDFAARYGGDEFLIVLCETNIQGCLGFTERLRKMIENHLFKNEAHAIQLTSSIGFAITKSGQVDIDARQLVRTADHALYEAKETGRNRVCFFDFAHPEKASQTAQKK